MPPPPRPGCADQTRWPCPGPKGACPPWWQAQLVALSEFGDSYCGIVLLMGQRRVGECRVRGEEAVEPVQRTWAPTKQGKYFFSSASSSSLLGHSLVSSPFTRCVPSLFFIGVGLSVLGFPRPPLSTAVKSKSTDLGPAATTHAANASTYSGARPLPYPGQAVAANQLEKRSFLGAGVV